MSSSLRPGIVDKARHANSTLCKLLCAASNAHILGAYEMTTAKTDRRRDPATTAKGRATANRVVLDKAIDAYRVIAPFILNLHGSGNSLGSIAEALNAAGHRTREGATFSPKTIARIIARSSSVSNKGGVA
jgi:hypothetical protein